MAERSWLVAAAALIAGAWPFAAAAQTPARFSLDSVGAVDLFRGESTVDRPNMIVDITAVVRLGSGWVVYVRPWFRSPREPRWDKEIYQAAVQYERYGPVSLRVDAGYIVSPIGLGMMDSRPGVNPTIAPHVAYFSPMPAFDPGAPRIQPIASSYPLGAQVTVSSRGWDARAAIVNSAPTRSYVINDDGNPSQTPVVVAGAGLSPRIGLRVGVSLAQGTYVTADEIAGPSGNGRDLLMIGMEGEYAFGYTRLSGEITRDRLETAFGTETAYAWFLQGMQTLSPRWFVAARQEGASAPPMRTPASPTPRRAMHTTEATLGFRLAAGLTLRSSFMSRKAYTRTAWDQQFGVSLVWAQQWW